MRKLLMAALLLQALVAGKALAATDCERFVVAQLAMEEKALALICAGKTDEEAQPEIDAYMEKTYPERTFGPYPFQMTRFLTGYGVCTKGLSPMRKDLKKMAAMCVQQKWDLSPYRKTAAEPVVEISSPKQ